MPHKVYYSMPQLINPLYDIGFKLLLGRENVSEEVLMNFLNTIFDGDPQLSNIVNLRYLNSERPGELETGKGIRYDIMCETSTGHRFIVEMQKAPQHNFIQRGEYYVCRGIAEQGYRGKNNEDLDWDYQLTPVIGVFLCNFYITGLERKVLTSARMIDEENGKPVDNLMRLIYIQLPAFLKEEIECESGFDQWIYNLKNMGLRQTVAFQGQNEIFQRLASIGNIASLSPEERRSYEIDLKRARDMYSQLKYASDEGRAVGLAEGRIEGYKETARNLKRMGLPLEQIQEATGLDMEYLRSI